MFLVAGGRDSSDTPSSSTELMLENSNVWSITSPLPRALYSVKGMTLGNTFYMSGGSYYDSTMLSGIIIMYSGIYLSVSQVVRMRMASTGMRSSPGLMRGRDGKRWGR